jgi:carbonic anhydrase/acetyltransferase-like protein (isoleucine patch superfamily)
MTRVLLIGARAGYTQELIFIANSCGLEPRPVEFFLDQGFQEDFLLAHVDRGESEGFVLCPSPPGIRKSMSDVLLAMGLTPHEWFAHPLTAIAPSVLVDAGTTINSMVAIGTHVKLGCHVQVNRGVTLGHDTIISDFVTIGPSAVVTGNNRVGSGVFIGAGAIINPGLKIGANAIIGSGAVVLRDVPEFTTIVGNPGAAIRESGTGYAGYSVVESL